MASNMRPALPTHDLRSESKSYNRDKSHNTKWEHGTRLRTGVKCPHLRHQFDATCTDCLIKPATVEGNHGRIKNTKMYKKRQNGQASTLARKAFRNDLDEAFDGPLAGISDTGSSDEEMRQACAPLPAEADFMYSYDATSGPAEGRDVLSSAITKAVQRFENTETEKLVTREYNVVDNVEEEYAADDEDFEMINYSHLQ